jgi:hypothetical protein
LIGRQSNGPLPPTKRQRFNQRSGRQAMVRIPVDGLPAPVEVVIVRFDQRIGTVEFEISVTATIGHRTKAFTDEIGTALRKDPDEATLIGVATRKTALATVLLLS